MPMLIGASGPRMLGITARHAAIWNTRSPLDEAKAKSDLLDAKCRDIGRDPAEIMRSVWPFQSQLGSVDTLASYITSFRAEGFDDFLFSWPSKDAEMEVLVEAAGSTIPEMRGYGGDANNGGVLAFTVAGLTLLLIPGPAVMYITALGLRAGRRTAIAAASGLGIGNFTHVLAAALGLSALLVSSALAFSVVKYIGAAYLIYLGIQTLRNDDRPGETAEDARHICDPGIPAWNRSEYVQSEGGCLLSGLRPAVHQPGSRRGLVSGAHSRRVVLGPGSRHRCAIRGDGRGDRRLDTRPARISAGNHQRERRDLHPARAHRRNHLD